MVNKFVPRITESERKKIYKKEAVKITYPLTSCMSLMKTLNQILQRRPSRAQGSI